MKWVPFVAANGWPLVAPESGASRIAQQVLDPYVSWGAATGFSGFTTNAQFRRPPGQTWVSVLIRLREGVNTASLLSNFDGKLYLPYAYSRPSHAGLANTRHLSGRIQLQYLWKLRTNPVIEAWELGVARLTGLDDEGVQPGEGLANVRAPVAVAARASVVGESVRQREKWLAARKAWRAVRKTRRAPGVIGVIDHGFAIFNRQFFGEDGGPRLRCLWDQHQRRQGPADPTWRSSPAFGYGRELRFPQLTPWVAPGGPADEMQAYRDLGYLHQRADPLRSIKTHAHGTHVLDVAAGLQDRWTAGRTADAASGADLHLVHLPVQTAADGSGGSLGLHVLDGVRSILHRASVDEKVMIVISQGVHAGPHDGSSLVEQALDELLERKPENFAIVIGAGNGRRTGDNVPVACHAFAQPTPGKPVTLSLMLPPGDDSDTYVELWYPEGRKLEVQVFPPGGRPAGPEEAAGLDWMLWDNGSVSAAVFHAGAVQGSDFAVILLACSPTRRGPAGRQAPPGLWQLKLRVRDGGPCDVDAWVERDEPVIGSGATWPRFLGPQVVDDGTLNGMATGRHTLVASALRRHNGTASPYASLGPHRNPQRTMPCPNAWAAADDSSALRGVRAAGVPSGYVVRMSGTSVAAPTLARGLFNAMADPDAKPVGRDGWQALIDRVAGQSSGLITTLAPESSPAEPVPPPAP